MTNHDYTAKSDPIHLPHTHRSVTNHRCWQSSAPTVPPAPASTSLRSRYHWTKHAPLHFLHSGESLDPSEPARSGGRRRHCQRCQHQTPESRPLRFSPDCHNKFVQDSWPFFLSVQIIPIETYCFCIFWLRRLCNVHTRIVCTLSEWCGGWPTIISWMRQPNAQQSTLRSENMSHVDTYKLLAFGACLIVLEIINN